LEELQPVFAEGFQEGGAAEMGQWGLMVWDWNVLQGQREVVEGAPSAVALKGAAVFLQDGLVCDPGHLLGRVRVVGILVDPAAGGLNGQRLARGKILVFVAEGAQLLDLFGAARESRLDLLSSTRE